MRVLRIAYKAFILFAVVRKRQYWKGTEIYIMVYIIIYLAVINALAFCMYGADKRKAVKGNWRIPEKTLILLAVLGGSVGAIWGMRFFHHKTKHKKFYIGLPFIFAVQMAAAIAVAALLITGN